MLFLLFPSCRGEAGILVTAKHGYFRDLLPSVPVVGLFSPFSSSFAFLKSLFTHSSHLSCGLTRFLEPSCFFVSALFGSVSAFIRTMCPGHFIRLLTILPTIQALVPTSSRRSFILRLSTLLTPANMSANSESKHSMKQDKLFLCSNIVRFVLNMAVRKLFAKVSGIRCKF